MVVLALVVLQSYFLAVEVEKRGKNRRVELKRRRRRKGEEDSKREI